MTALIAAGQDFSTLSMEGANLALCTTVNTLTVPEYPLQPIQLGTRTNGSDGGVYVYCTPAAAYTIGTAGYISNDGKWTFTALTTSNATLSGSMVGVMSQVGSTSTPSSTLYDCVWVQVAGGCPGVKATASASASVALYTSTTAGELGSSSASSAVLISGIVLSTAALSSPAQNNAPAVMIFPQVLLT